MIKRDEATQVFAANTIKVVHPVGSPTRPGGGPVVRNALDAARRLSSRQVACSLMIPSLLSSYC